MANVLPPPILVVRPQHSARGRRFVVLILLAWMLSLALAFGLGHMARQWVDGLVDHAALASAKKDRDAQLQRIAVLERAEQVARAANGDLQQSLRDRQEEIAGLRADLAFYSRLTDGASKLEGLNVHGIHLQAGAAPRVYNFTITLTQTLKSGQVASGYVRLSVSGVQAGKLTTLAWSELAPNQDVSGLVFSFKYFQQIAGTLMVPEGFAPNRIRVEADAGGDMGRADQEFAWTDAIADQAAQEVSDVQH
jgi:hypothetical protein